MLDKLHGVCQQLDMMPKTINNVTIQQHSETQAIVLDAARHMGEQKNDQGGIVTSIELFEVSSTSVADSVLGNLQFVRMDDRHEEVAETFGKTFEWAYNEPKSDRPWSSFTAWLREGNGIYWINGKAGSGKSMRYLFDNPRARYELRV